jgi:hypothetical protein
MPTKKKALPLHDGMKNWQFEMRTEKDFTKKILYLCESTGKS